MILLLIILFIIASIFMYHFIEAKLFNEHSKRIDDKLRRMMDAVKTFFTVTLIDKLSSTDDTDSDDSKIGRAHV